MKISMMTMVENDSTIKSINAWIDYHKFLGIDEFFIYWNGFEDISFIERMIVNKKNVNLIPWPYFRENREEVGNTNNQIKAMTNILNFGKRIFDWTFYMDVDEYLIVKNKKLKDYLENIDQDISAVVMRGVCATMNSAEKLLKPAVDGEEIHIEDIKNAKVYKYELEDQKENPTKFLCKNIETTKLFVHFPVVCDNKIVYDNNQEEIYYLHFFNLSRFIGRANTEHFPVEETNWPFEKKDGS
jgi:hypothetical protein